jgi:iron complex transport system ATP-binding protein
MKHMADELMEELEIANLAERKAEEMSSGEARRMVIARALVHRPKALVLDEPTNSLDFHAMHGLRATMSRIAQGGTGLILVTHHLDDIVPEVTRVVLLERKRIAADARRKRFSRRRSYRRCFKPKSMSRNVTAITGSGSCGLRGGAAGNWY